MMQPHSRSACTSHGYRVEVRDNLLSYSYHAPIILDDGMVTDRWREVVTRKYPYSPDTFAARISLMPSRCNEAALSDLLPYETAFAMANWLISLHPLSQIQCRLVAYRLEWTSTLIREGIVDEPLIVTEVSPAKIGHKPKVKPDVEQTAATEQVGA